MKKEFVKKGFGIIEVLVASTIISIVIFALTAAGKSAMRLSQNTEERAIANNLCQEGIEIAREMRDTNWFDKDASTDWDSLLYNNATKVWTKVPKDGTLYDISFDATSKRFFLTKEDDPSSLGEAINMGGNSSFVFYRKVKVESVGDLLPGILSDTTSSKDIFAMKVTVEVFTPGGKTISASELITNWRTEY